MQNRREEIRFFDREVEESGYYQVYPDREYRRILEETGILEEAKRRRILEVGCGTGAFSVRLAEHGFRSVTGLDISPRAIEEARKIAAQKGLSSLEYCSGDMLDLPFEENSFDAVFAGAALHHLPNNLAECATEFCRVLVPEGRVYMFEPYALNLSSFLFYHVFNFSRTSNEKALLPGKVKKVFQERGFHQFSWRKLGYVQHVVSPGAGARIKGLVNKYVLRNEFFVGACRCRPAS